MHSTNRTRREPRTTTHGAPGGSSRLMTRLMLSLAFSAAFSAASSPALAASDGVYVAGQGSSVEQAFSQALAENQGKKQAFWIVVAGPDVARFSKAKASAALAERVKTVRAQGGVVFVCRSDLNRNRIKEEDLVDGVASVYGYGQQDWAGLLPAKKEQVALPESTRQSERIIRTCSGNEKGNGL